LPGFGEFVRQTLYWHSVRLLDGHESGSLVAAGCGRRRDGARKVLGGLEENVDIEDGFSGEAGNGRAADLLDGQRQAVKCVC